MRKIFAGFIITVMMFSGCGVAKNLQDPGSKPAPTLPKNNENNRFLHHYNKKAPTFKQCVSAVIMASLGYGCLFILETCYNGKTPADNTNPA